jgi:hypothetical protein
MALYSDSVRLRAQGSEFLADSANHATGQIESLLDLGTRIHYRVRLASGSHLEIEQPINDPLLDQPVAPGTSVVLRVPRQNTRFFSQPNHS